ncbi:DNA-3-methyladenine glycosylase II [Kribbella voronezhensis]|uniref:DNA-3-methyladenine glycosylase II n=1 Tax=Kribbella voronezhensis TaxID=2512212 RepID=A0A4R7TH55_9ACTN|nr:AlkA N-terminal domain-containing protein [Kribbella voronezhensis]TDU90807.1 DNA-3-methyladenine glycosylase II [Kribbella voronezhensis]
MTTYSAVRTTGIYCRPGCGAKPLAENVRTFEVAAAAEAEGYRACLRCRPYRVAGTVADDAPELVCRAVQLIISGVLDAADETALGAQLGMSARHLRRLFNDHLGVTPDQFARSRRAHFARRLLDDSELTIADIAFASGFGSLRQFNRAMREVFRATPRELRERRRRSDRLAADGGLVLRMPYSPPYDWDAMTAFLARNAVPGVESVVDGVYRRTIALDGDLGMLEIGPGGVDHLLLKAHLPYWEGAIHVVERAGCLVGLTTEPILATAQLAGDPVIGPLIKARPGVRVPGAWGPFEVAIQAVVTHHPALMTPAMGAEVLRRVVEGAGVVVSGLGFGLTHAFPSAEAVAGAELYGVPEEVGRTVRALAGEVAEGNLSLAACAPLEELTGALLAIDGVSETAAQWIALRLGARDASPKTKEPNEEWRPWRALATMQLEAAEQTA